LDKRASSYFLFTHLKECIGLFDHRQLPIEFKGRELTLAMAMIAQSVTGWHQKLWGLDRIVDWQSADIPDKSSNCTNFIKEPRISNVYNYYLAIRLISRDVQLIGDKVKTGGYIPPWKNAKHSRATQIGGICLFATAISHERCGIASQLCWESGKVGCTRILPLRGIHY
jgi:hypothetical protein